MKTKGWEKIYKAQGEVQSKILPKVKNYSKVFKAKGFKRILDLGCGTGRNIIYLAKQGFSVYATDISKTAIEITENKAKLLNLKNIKFKKHDMKRIPYRNNFFDAVICIWTIDHGTLSDIQKTVNEIYRVLKPDSMVITDFVSVKDETYGKGKEISKNTFVGYIKNEEDIPHHYSTQKELVELFSKFKKVRISPKDYSYKDEKNKKHIIKAFDVEAVK